MSTHRYTITVEAPAAQVWEALADFGGVVRYNPNVTASYLTGDLATGVGATRHCDLTFPGATVEERITSWQEGRAYVAEIYSGEKTPPFRHAQATLEVEPLGSEASTVTATLDYDLRFGPVGALMDRLMVSPKFGPAFGRLLVGLKHHVETGDEVTASSDLSSAATALTPAGR